jgi:outer membrane protein with beta-barrel domain
MLNNPLSKPNILVILIRRVGIFMRHRFTFAVIAVAALMLPSTPKLIAQATDDSRFEVAGHLTLLRFYGTRVGGGGRITYNINDAFALEGEANFLPDNGDYLFSGGRQSQYLFGLKSGQRGETVGIFGKVRPGFVQFNRYFIGENNPVCGGFTLPGECFGTRRNFALDVGGGFEYYPNRFTVIRFDFSNLIIRYLGETDSTLQIGIGAGLRF